MRPPTGQGTGFLWHRLPAPHATPSSANCCGVSVNSTSTTRAAPVAALRPSPTCGTRGPARDFPAWPPRGWVVPLGDLRELPAAADAAGRAKHPSIVSSRADRRGTGVRRAHQGVEVQRFGNHGEGPVGVSGP